MDQSKLNKSFEIASVSRADLQTIFSLEEIACLTNADMKEIAKKMGDLHCDLAYWQDLESTAKTVLEERQARNAKRPAKPKNLCTKRMTPETAYEVWQNGIFTYWILKKYQTPEQEAKNVYARWYCAVVSPLTEKTFQYGDTYVREITVGGYKIANPLAMKQEEKQ
jgi:hypothetical protein